MANKCTHTEPGCGCVDGPMITPPACPPLPCDNPQPCSSYTDAQCVIYTGEDIECNEQIVVETNANLNDIIIELVTRICDLENQINPPVPAPEPAPEPEPAP
jgi:hypothetical protein